MSKRGINISRVLAVVMLLAPFMAVSQISNQDLQTILVVRDLERESRPFRSGSLGPEVEGDPYLWTTWSRGSITLYRDSKVFDVPGFKYDALNHGIDILFDPDKIKSLDGNHAQAFEYKDSLTQLPHRFVNAKDYTLDGVPMRGFLEVLCWGKVDVYAFVEVSMTKPNYNVAIGSGNQNYQISKKRVLLYSPGPELRPLSKKEISKLWTERQAEMTKFQKVNKLNLSRERDLLLMVDYFNTL